MSIFWCWADALRAAARIASPPRHVVHGWMSAVRLSPMPPGGRAQPIIEAAARGRGMALCWPS
ncbi:hypothetical protein Q4610_04340 [Sphingobium sp. HBC34]|uniref:Uncharacterized protein n=1 Tax=Sphingobium cyanobacteriorum TaxID=3063954 RepID=A0ABT8ZIA0_9SPHN|nr:hypothetical protein [Sphingobium sp. HBC34]MDO7834267.1 hypothetical protein [Sphingobium sp. HBC34]